MKHIFTEALVLCTAAVTLFAIASPAAAQQTWTHLGGNDLWSNATNWSTAEPGSGDIATFATPVPGTNDVSLGAGELASSLVFNAAYILTGGDLTLSSGQITANDGNTTIGSVLGGSAGLTKLGSAGLILQGANTYSGATSVVDGTLDVSGNERLPDSSAVTVAGGATLRFFDGITETIGSLAGAGNVEFGGGGHELIVGANGINTDFSGFITESGGTGALAKIGAGTQTISGNLTYSGMTQVTGGELALGFGGLNAGDDVTVDGATLSSSTFGFNLATGKTLTASNNAVIDFVDQYELDDGTTFTIQSGADFTTRDFLDIGNGTDGTLVVEGIGSSLNAGTASPNFLDWGKDGGTATVTIRDDATAVIDATSIVVARVSNPSSSGILNVQSGADVTVNLLNFASGAAGSASITVDGVNSTLTQTGSSTLTLGGLGTGTATIDVTDQGTFTTGTGTIIINTSGLVHIDRGTFNANGTVIVDGGALTRSSGDFNLASGLTLTAANEAQVNFSGDYEIDQGTTFNITFGADFSTTSFLDIGVSSDGTLLVDGAGSSVTTGASTSFWGFAGNTADVTFRNGATGNLAGISLARGSTAGTTGVFKVQSGATVTTNSLSMVKLGGATTTATVTVDGAGSSLTLNGASTLSVGHASTGTGTINVTNDGEISTGTGAIAVNTTGAINIGTGMTGGTFNALGPMTIDGTVNLADGEMTAGMVTLGSGAFNFTGGVLHVDDFIGNLDNQGGTLAPGNTPGITNVTGDYTNQTAATVEIEIASGGGVPGMDFDQVNISAAANLDGALFADMGFTPAHKESFQVMTFASRSGVFSSVTDSGLPDMLVMAPFYTATDLTLSVELLGDANGNGVVEAADYTLWANGFGIAEPSYNNGDFNRNGIVDPGDYTTWANNFGLVASAPEAGATAAVPEPSTFVLLITALLSLVAIHARVRGATPN